MKLTSFRFFLLILIIAILGIVGSWLAFLYTPLIPEQKGLRYVVREGATVNGVVDELYKRKIINHPGLFRLLIKAKGADRDLKAGEYHFKQGTYPSKLLEQLTTGSGLVYHSFTIIPGKTFSEIKSKLASDENLTHTIDKISDAEIMSKLGHPGLNPEGEFFPDTYFFVDGTDDLIILKKAFKAMEEKLAKLWHERDKGLPYKNQYEALIASSIIEKEAYLEEELPKIAGVMVNRLKGDMLLQFDPTVIYGLGDRYTGTIRRTDLLDDNPYNTYIRKGLPPTPICMPSLAAIQATLHPSQHDYYYFVAKKDRSSQFSKKLDEHAKAVAQIRRQRGFFNTNLMSFYLLNFFN